MAIRTGHATALAPTEPLVRAFLIESCSMPAHGDFKLSISKALTDQLHEALHALDSTPLTAENLGALESRQGVYQLYRAGDLVYVGSASGSLPTRLGQHLRKLSGRQNIAAHEVEFTCLYVDEDLTVLAPEDRLIGLFRDEGSCAWNGNGFGPHDPGRRRDETRLAPDHFDIQFPIRLDWTLDDIPAGWINLQNLLRRVKADLPYTFRFANEARDRERYRIDVEVPQRGMSARDLFEFIAGALPQYQVTALPGYVIMYRETRDYPQGEILRSPG